MSRRLSRRCSERGTECPLSGAELEAAASRNEGIPRDKFGLPLRRPENSCPRMRADDYTALQGPIYVEQFGVDLSGSNWSVGAPHTKTMAANWFDWRQERDDNIQASAAAVRLASTRVFFTEELSQGAR